jgi:ribonuclease E
MDEPQPAAAEGGERDGDGERPRRRRGRRGGRWRNRDGTVAENGAGGEVGEETPAAEAAEAVVEAAIESAEIPPVEIGDHMPPAAVSAPGVPELEPSPAEAQAEAVVEAAIESAEIPVEIGDREPPPAAPEPSVPELAPSQVEALVEAAIEGAEIPPVEDEPAAGEPEREFEPAMANGDPPVRSAAEPMPVPVDVHAVTEKPEAPRRGWWQRLTQP